MDSSCKYLRHIATFYITHIIYTVSTFKRLSFQDFHIAKVVQMKNAKFPSKISLHFVRNFLNAQSRHGKSCTKIAKLAFVIRKCTLFLRR